MTYEALLAKFEAASKIDIASGNCSELEITMIDSFGGEGPYAIEDEPTTKDLIAHARRVAESCKHAVELRAALERLETENTYYVVCNANGPISVRLKATTEREALAEFEKLDGHAAVDGCRTDAEDELIDDTVDCHAMDVFQFGRELERAGATHVLHLDHDWSLWVVTPD